MTSPPQSARLKDWRVVLLAVGCTLVGFLFAALLFGKPWHLPPAWGDIPTWLAFIAASAAAVAALIQLSRQQKQITEEAARNEKRDKLLDSQLVEAAERMKAYRRQQAEQIILTGFRVRPSRDGNPGRPGSCQVANESGRPIRDVTCRASVDGNLSLPTEFRIEAEFFPAIGSAATASTTSYLPADDGTFDLGTGSYLHLLANQIIRVGFPADTADAGNVRYLIRFADDAENRWQLDADMHLTVPPDSDW